MAQKQERLAIKVLLPPCRMSFPWLFKPQDTDNGPKYQLNMLFPPKTDFKKFEDALFDAMEDMFGKDEKKWPKGRNDRGPYDVIRDATEKDYEGYKEGWKFIKAASKDPVGIVDARRNPVLQASEVYGGRWCRCSVTVLAYDNKSKGVGVYLNSVQLLDHDEQFGGRGEAKNDFEDWEGDALSDDERGTGTGTHTSRSRGSDRDDDDRDSRRGRDEGRRSSRDDEDDRDSRSSRGSRDDDRRGSSRVRDRDEGPEDRRGARDTRDRDRDDRGSRDDDRGSRRSRDEDDRGSRRGDDDERGSRGRDRDTRDDDRGRGRDRDADERPSRGRSRDADDEEWN